VFTVHGSWRGIYEQLDFGACHGACPLGQGTCRSPQSFGRNTNEYMPPQVETILDPNAIVLKKIQIDENNFRMNWIG